MEISEIYEYTKTNNGWCKNERKIRKKENTVNGREYESHNGN